MLHPRGQIGHLPHPDPANAGDQIASSRACPGGRATRGHLKHSHTAPPIGAIIDTVTRTLEKAEPELAADLVDNGILLAGGGALVRGMTTVLSNATGLECYLADDPLTCVARGTAIYLENLELWKDTMESDRDQF